MEEEIKAGSNIVYVMGEVASPGAFEGKKGATFMDILLTQVAQPVLLSRAKSASSKRAAVCLNSTLLPTPKVSTVNALP